MCACPSSDRAAESRSLDVNALACQGRWSMLTDCGGESYELMKGHIIVSDALRSLEVRLASWTHRRSLPPFIDGGAELRSLDVNALACQAVPNLAKTLVQSGWKDKLCAKKVCGASTANGRVQQESSPNT